MANGRITFGSQKLSRAFQQYEENYLKEIKRIVVETAQIIVSNARLLAPADDGNLRDSIEMEILNDGMTAVIRVTAAYAIFVNFGTGIYAKEGNGRETPWSYYSDKLGRFVTTRGQRPQEFWGPAVDQGERYFETETRKLG